ncbi:MAG: metallophosphoesterase, partial [Chloroflexota bacterium]|nr:metallophosphoesterase [Chloroflexota bacterium]
GSPPGSPPASPGTPPIASGSSVGPSIGPGGSGDETIVLTGAGDIADCSLPGSSQTSDLLLAQTGFVFTAGDNAYANGSPTDFAACYGPTWGRVLDRTILPAPGNHDWNTDDAAGYRAYFGPTAAGPGGTTWYAKDVGAWHVVVLDSDCSSVGGCDAASAQGQWLASDLAASDARCTLAIWHHPRFSSGLHGNDEAVGPFWEILHAAGADLIVNGHDHDYERFAPQTPAGDELRPGGIREIVIGTGGAELRTFHAIAENSEFRQAGTWGVLRLTLKPANYEWEFLPVNGSIADSGSTPCH